MEYTVWVDDNFHYMDESERYRHGVFSDPKAAVAACKRIVDECLGNPSAEGPDAMYTGYTMFGEDPWISSADPGCQFSAWNYAKARCHELARGEPPAGSSFEFAVETSLSPSEIVDRLRSTGVPWWTEGAPPGQIDFAIRAPDGTAIRLVREATEGPVSAAIRASSETVVEKMQRAVTRLLADEPPITPVFETASGST
jgi:hypothetical protein